VGQSVNAQGTIAPPHPGVTVTLTYQRPDGFKTIQTATTDPAGNYADTYKPDSTGSYTAKASWQGDVDHESATSPGSTFSVDKATPTMTCQVYPPLGPVGASVVVSGTLSPARSSATLTMTFTRPDGANLTLRCTTRTDGSYNQAFTPDLGGQWWVQASWEGDSSYTACQSLKAGLVVLGDEMSRFGLLLAPAALAALSQRCRRKSNGSRQGAYRSRLTVLIDSGISF
jgi:hypothetical protein